MNFVTVLLAVVMMTTDEIYKMDKLLTKMRHRHPWLFLDDNRLYLDHNEDQENETMDNHEGDDLAMVI